MANSQLTFFYPQLAANISTDISLIEEYSNNLVVSPAIGTLVAYYSDERPTPYLAESWSQEGKIWKFNIRENLKCENGEVISASSFKDSLTRSIKIYSRGTEHPVFKYLEGYNSFINGSSKDLKGLSFDGKSLEFKFTKVLRGGFLEHLSMAPFGYICSENFVGDSWKDPKRIISSGPFSLSAINDNSQYILSRRTDIPLQFQGGPKTVKITRGDITQFREWNGPKLMEGHSDGMPKDDFKFIRQAPQTLFIVKLNHKSEVFQDLKVRQMFTQEFRKQFEKYNFISDTYSKTQTFFHNDKIKELPTNVSASKNPVRTHLVMKLMKRGKNTPNEANQIILERTVEALGWTIEFDSEPYTSFKETYSSPKFDLYMQGAEVGGGFEGWVIDMLFCSDIGDMWPDPSGRICKLTQRFENEEEISITAANQEFHSILQEDATVIPTFHRGGFYLMSNEIDTNSLSPIITRVRFDEIRIKD